MDEQEIQALALGGPFGPDLVSLIRVIIRDEVRQAVLAVDSNRRNGFSQPGNVAADVIREIINPDPTRTEEQG